jgi:hypothetical protein
MFKIIHKSSDVTIIELAFQSQLDTWKEIYPNDVALVTIEGEAEPEAMVDNVSE